MKETLQAAAGAVKPEASSAHALTDSYARLRAGALLLMEENDDLKQEFLSTFPEMEVTPGPEQGMPLDKFVMRGASDEIAAQRAAALLSQMAGWFEGIVAEQTLERRLELEAQERIKQERRIPPGFIS